MSHSRKFEESFANTHLNGGYSWRMYGPQSVVISMAIVMPLLYALGHWLSDSGMMDSEYTYDQHADGPMADLYDALLTARDGGSCGGRCGEVVSRLDASGRDAAGACIDEGDSLHVRNMFGDQREKILVTLTCGDGALWRAELRNDVSDDILLGGGELPSNWIIVSLEPDAP